jgi:phage FluMu protein Com
MKNGSNALKISVIVACVVLVLVILGLRLFSDDSGLNELEGQMVLVKCNNPACYSTYEMDKKKFYSQLRDSLKTSKGFTTPAIKCDKCDEMSAYKAIKCEKCGEIFFESQGAASDFGDRCPFCKYSKSEELQKGSVKKQK